MTPLPEGAGPDSVSQLPSLLQEKNNIEERPALVTASNWGFFAIRKGPWKAIFGTKWSGGSILKSAKYGSKPPKGTPPDDPTIGQLYDISSDPFETMDLWKSRPKVVETLRHELQEIKDIEPGDEFPGKPAND